MQFTNKIYKFFKIQNYLKQNKIFLIYNSINLKIISWQKIEKELIFQKLNYYKLANKLALKILYNSIYKNFFGIIKCLTVFVDISLNLKINNLIKINPLFHLIGIKINNKIYLKNQIKKINNLNYKNNIFLFYNKLKIFLIFFLKFFRNNVI